MLPGVSCEPIRIPIHPVRGSTSPVTGLATGVYIVRVKTGSEVASKRLLVSNPGKYGPGEHWLLNVYTLRLFPDRNHTLLYD